MSLIDTGVNTMTGGRLLRLKNYLKKDENFLFTYGDGLSNVNIKKLLEFHKKTQKNCYSYCSNTTWKIWGFNYE